MALDFPCRKWSAANNSKCVVPHQCNARHRAEGRRSATAQRQRNAVPTDGVATADGKGGQKCQTQQLLTRENVKAIVPLDDVQSVNSVQKALLRRFPDNKFLVMCAMAGEGRTEGKETLPNEVHLSSSGHGYCNVVSERIWCQAAAVVG
ncbi:hypothetical protein niasHT_016369 [Heterodera trifolii]|uniref:Uncharacterized protein n=1 Tax=Heterodera trifolii TaxID=157864 RepID=A0ABD2KZ49_9BILA